VEAVGPEEKFYNLVEFPYPSSEGLHVGHVYTYAGADTYGRYLRMRGKTVFQPIGFDSFGIHTENFALRVGEHPQTLTERTIAAYREQLRSIGAAWDWGHEVVTSDPGYYRWTQWVFLQLYRAGLAVRREAPVVWCPTCLTVLAFEQLEGDRCERCGTPVVRRVMRQWFLRITSYADALLAALEGLDWPESAKRLQREWIGRSSGVEIDFDVENSENRLTAFTTRPDTLFGVTFLAVSPEHPIAHELASGTERQVGVDALIEATVRVTGPAGKTDAMAGEFTGRWAVHPGSGQRVPVFVAPYVVGTYGTGVVMGVPAHDERDHRFATQHGVPVIRVIAAEHAVESECWTGEGVLVDSGPFTGMRSEEARPAITDALERSGKGRPAITYRLHDWLISRQRYWGPPIPIVYCARCGEVPVPESDLPVLLPDVANVADVRPTGTGRSPLAAIDLFVHTECPSCGGPAERETDVSDTFLDSAWYFLRYPSSDVSERPWDPDRTARLLPVDQYAGGPEHVVRHHLYARFVTRALHDLGHLPFAEPFPRLRLHGLLIKDGAKMSKSRGNVVAPDHYIGRVGADNLRMALLFCGPWEEGGDFTDRGLEGIRRFSARVSRLVAEPHEPGPGGRDLRTLDRIVARVQEDIERFKFHTALSAVMEMVRWLGGEKHAMSADEWLRSVRTLALLLAPLAPHLAEELWSRIGGGYSVHRQPWPEVDPGALTDEEFEVGIQVDGKLRGRCRVPADATREEVVRVALASPNVRRHLPNGMPSKVVYVPGRVVNLLT
jgi:leucyl-tRNA synthetase